ASMVSGVAVRGFGAVVTPRGSATPEFLQVSRRSQLPVRPKKTNCRRREPRTRTHGRRPRYRPIARAESKARCNASPVALLDTRYGARLSPDRWLETANEAESRGLILVPPASV